MSKVRGKLTCLIINDLDAGIGRFGNTQVNIGAPCRDLQSPNPCPCLWEGLHGVKDHPRGLAARLPGDKGNLS